MSLLSIIIPVYNVEDFLVECLESVIKQSFTDFEVILINDGSLDNSGRICDDYERRDSRINVIHKKNGGVSDARNEGLKVAQGQYIIFLDGDDYFGNDNPIDSILEIMVDNKLDMSISPFQKFSKDGEIVSYLPMNELHNILERDKMYKALSLSKTTFWGSGKNIYKRKVISDNNIWFRKNLICAEDCDFFMECARHSERYVLYNKPIIHYRINREGSATTTMSTDAILGQLKVFYDNYYEYLCLFSSDANRALVYYFANKFADTLTLIDRNISESDLEEIIAYIKTHIVILDYTKGLKYKVAKILWKLVGIPNGTYLINLIRKS